MKNRFFIPAIFLVGSISFSHHLYSQNDIRIWREFTGLLKAGKMTVDRIRPLKQLGDSFKPLLLGYLDSVRVQASPADWDTPPEVIRVEDRIEFLVPWSAGEQKTTYCFSFVGDANRWYFQHLESIFIRLDKLGRLPTSAFPDVSEEQKAWAREEIYWSFLVLNVYLPLSAERGKESVLNLFKDGGGYFVGARTWVPFTAPHKAFVLYLCWEQSKLRGNHVTLERLDDNEAVVRLKTKFYDLYFTAAHLKTVIPLEDYKKIFETIWQDRAVNAGWRLDIHYSPEYEVTFHLTRRD